MAQQVRRIYLENEAGARIDCLLRTSFFNDLSGLGFSNEYEFLTSRDGFFYTTKEQSQQQTIAGKLSFLNRRDAYSDYRTFTSWLNGAKNISIVYIPFGSTEYYVDVKILSMSKGELDTGGFLSCDIEFITTTPYYSKQAVQLSFDGSLLEGIKRYDYSYNYKYALSSTAGELSVSIDGDYDGGMQFTAYGGLEDPILSLFNSNTGEVYGYLDLTGTAIEEGSQLVFNTTFKNSGIWMKTGTTYTSLVDDVVVHPNMDVFFLIPRNTPLTMKFQVAGAITTGTEILIYRYWKTR